MEHRSSVSQKDEELLRQDRALAEVVRRLVGAYQPDRIYLFGSKARGDGDLDSDYDLMVVVPEDARPERRRGRLAYEVLRGTGTAAAYLSDRERWPGAASRPTAPARRLSGEMSCVQVRRQGDSLAGRAGPTSDPF